MFPVCDIGYCVGTEEVKKIKIDIDLRIVSGILGIIVVVMFLMYAGTYVGFDAELTTDIVGVLPGLMVIFVGVIVLATQKLNTFALPGFGALGLGIAILLEEMNTHGIVVDDYITSGYTLVEIQAFFLIVMFLTGIVAMGVARH